MTVAMATKPRRLIIFGGDDRNVPSWLLGHEDLHVQHFKTNGSISSIDRGVCLDTRADIIIIMRWVSHLQAEFAGAFARKNNIPVFNGVSSWAWFADKCRVKDDTKWFFDLYCERVGRQKGGRVPSFPPPYFSTWMNEVLAIIVEKNATNGSGIRYATIVDALMSENPAIQIEFAKRTASGGLRNLEKKGIIFGTGTPRSRKYSMTDPRLAWDTLISDRQPTFEAPWAEEATADDTVEEALEAPVTQTKLGFAREDEETPSEPVDEEQKDLLDVLEEFDTAMADFEDMLQRMRNLSSEVRTLSREPFERAKAAEEKVATMKSLVGDL